jgi:ABC-type amino acid transport substrate-binding protein
MVRRNETHIQDFRTTKSRRVCVPEKTTSEDAVNRTLGPNGAILQPLKSTKQCVDNLKKNRTDAIVATDITLKGLAAHPEHRDHVQVLNVPPIGAAERFGIALPNGNKQACEFLTAKLRTYLTSGAWDDHFRKNFPNEDINRFKPDPNHLDPCE